MTKTIFHFLLVSLFLFAISCEDYKDCNSPTETLLGIRFFHETAGEETDSVLPALTFYGVTKPDSLLLLNTSARQIFVPLNPNAKITRFFIRADSTLSGGDTISIQYKPDLRFVSSGCGFTNYYRLDTAMSTQHYIDSISLVNRKINTTNATNIKVYY